MKAKMPVLIKLGWLGFLVCLILPSGIESSGNYTYGWQFAGLTILQLIDADFHRGWRFYYYSLPSIGNFILAISPLLYIFAKNNRYIIIFIGVLLILFGLLSVSYLFDEGELSRGTLIIGYYIWVLSYFASGIGFLGFRGQIRIS